MRFCGTLSQKDQGVHWFCGRFDCSAELGHKRVRSFDELAFFVWQVSMVGWFYWTVSFRFLFDASFGRVDLNDCYIWRSLYYASLLWRTQFSLAFNTDSDATASHVKVLTGATLILRAC